MQPSATTLTAMWSTWGPPGKMGRGPLHRWSAVRTLWDVAAPGKSPIRVSDVRAPRDAAGRACRPRPPRGVRTSREATDPDVCVRLAKWRSCSRSWLPAFASDLTGFENRYGMGEEGRGRWWLSDGCRRTSTSEDVACVIMVDRGRLGFQVIFFYVLTSGPPCNAKLLGRRLKKD